MDSFNIKTNQRNEFVNITRQVAQYVNKSGVSEGLCIVFIPHTTCGVTINENADPAVPEDILSHLSKMIPQFSGFLHSEGNSDSHLKASLVGSSVNIIVGSGKLVLGTWQSVFLCEFDGPRTRKVFVQVISGPGE